MGRQVRQEKDNNQTKACNYVKMPQLTNAIQVHCFVARKVNILLQVRMQVEYPVFLKLDRSNKILQATGITAFNAIFRGKTHLNTVLIILAKRAVDMTIVKQWQIETTEPTWKDAVGGEEVLFKQLEFAILEY